MDRFSRDSSSTSIGRATGGGTNKNKSPSLGSGGGVTSGGNLNSVFMKPTSKSAPSSPPITTVTAASPEPPPLLTSTVDSSSVDPTVTHETNVPSVVAAAAAAAISSPSSLNKSREATGSDSLLLTSSVSSAVFASTATALQRFNNSNSNTCIVNNNNSNSSSQEQSTTASGGGGGNRYNISSATSTPDHPATLSPTSPISQRLAVISHPPAQYLSQLGQHRSSMQYIQTPGSGGGGGGGGGRANDGSGTTGSSVFTRRRGSSNAGQSGDRAGVSSSTSSVGGTGGGGGSGGTIRRKSREFVPGPIRRASQVLISLTSPDGASLYGECSRRDSRAVPQITLMSSTFQRLPMKDFGAEVRASMDVDQFLQQAVLLLDVNETSLEGIVDRIVKKVLDGREPLATIKEAKMVLFTHESVNLLARTIQGTYISEGGGFDYDQSWLCTMCALPSLQKRHVAIARLKHPANMGRNSHEVRFFIMVLTPSKEKGTKNAMETGRTFATIFADMDFRQKLLEIQSEGEFKSVLLKHAQDLAAEQSNPARRLGNHERSPNDLDDLEPKCHIAQGLCEDLRRRLSHYISDYVDGIVGRKTISKTISTIFFLYFACILPTVAFGVLNDNNTSGAIGDIRKAIIGQTIGGLFFGIFGGQPLVIIMTTAPLCLYAKVVFNICEDFNLNFHAMYACVGLWTSFFLIIYAAFDVSRLMKWCTRSTEEIFALFISIAFAVDAFRDVFKNFKNYYYSDVCTGEADNPLRRDPFLLLANATVNYTLSADRPLNGTSNVMKSTDSLHVSTSKNWNNNNVGDGGGGGGGGGGVGGINFSNLTDTLNTSSNNLINATIKSFVMSTIEPTAGTILNSDASSTVITSTAVCRRDSSLLFLLLMLGTVWIAITLYNFNKTPYLQASKRELLADYALPVAVILLSFIGSYIFRDIPVDHFRYNELLIIERAHIEDLPASAAFASMGLGFALSLLIFMDQNIAEAMVNNPCNKLKKGCAYHLDLFVVGILNGFLSIYGFPWMHGVLPHSPLHLRSLADVEERVDGGHVYEIIVRVRETRITQIISHILIGLSIFLVPYPLAYIPTAVLDGLFLYMAVTSLSGNQMFERITLLFMEQAAYPPNHYIRRCPQRKIHLFTLCQLTQLGIMCFFGFSPWAYVKMVFPVIILLLLPVRHKIVTYIIDNKYLDALDGEHQ